MKSSTSIKCGKCDLELRNVQSSTLGPGRNSNSTYKMHGELLLLKQEAVGDTISSDLKHLTK